ncbi:hypothetical protein PDJAM_G00269510, partial [Pangasius djambal]|nr:hypothetical protein [Pangasius djambal]
MENVGGVHAVPRDTNWSRSVGTGWAEPVRVVCVIDAGLRRIGAHTRAGCVRTAAALTDRKSHCAHTHTTPCV